MGLTISILSGLANDIGGVAKFISSNADDRKTVLRSISLKRSSSIIKPTRACSSTPKFVAVAASISPRQRSELDAAATTVQKVYKSYRTRRNLADCAVVVEELWWKALDFVSLERSSVLFFDGEKPETATSRWARARTRAAKVGKGLSKSDNAQKLALQHWLEAVRRTYIPNMVLIDPRHRYGHNLHLYYDIWLKSSSSQPFFYWLDIGDGKEVNIERCPRSTLQNQNIEYLGPNERKAYEAIVENGKLVYKQSRLLLHTAEGSKWIFVLSTSSDLYVGKKKKGKFQHSSFLSGGAITAAGSLVVDEGVLKAICPYSGHYLPTEENFKAFIDFLEHNNVDMTDVKRRAVDEDEYTSIEQRLKHEPEKKARKGAEGWSDAEEADTAVSSAGESRARLQCRWTTGAGPRIGCVRDYPTSLQSKALELVNLSPRGVNATIGNKEPVPSPSPRARLSPRLACIGAPGPNSPLLCANQR